MFHDLLTKLHIVTCFEYRQWSKNIYNLFYYKKFSKKEFFIILNYPKLVNKEFIGSINQYILFFYRLSDLIVPIIINKYFFMRCLH